MVLSRSRRRTSRVAWWLALCALLLCLGAAAAAKPQPGDRDDDSEDAVDLPDPPQSPLTTRAYTVNEATSDNLKLTPPTLPDLSGYTAQAVRAKLAPLPAAQVHVDEMLGRVEFKTFMGQNQLLREWAVRQGEVPKAIYIEGGGITPRELARALPPRYFEQTAPGVYVARLPILVGHDSRLLIDGTVKDFRLSRDRGAFLVNDGALFITDSRLTGWDEKRNDGALFEEEDRFRPYLVSWGGSHTYIVNSVVSHLGCAKSKAYGVSISQYPPSLKVQMTRPAPTGWFLDSEFFDLWYGFYCYEAEDFVLRGNRYHDNIKYGIDPHDRSRRLIIAGNEASDTRIKHGIIISREVNDSWIFGNRSFRNKLSGIVIDRSSVNTVVAQNQVYQNHSDGITVYESPDNLIWQNLCIGNARHGIRVRNSTGIRLYDNVAVDNGLAGVYGHIKDLTDQHRKAIDKFRQAASMLIVGGKLISNGSGPVTIDRPFRLEIYDVEFLTPKRPFGIKMTGVLGEHQDQILDILVRQRKAVILKPEGAPDSEIKTKG